MKLGIITEKSKPKQKYKAHIYKHMRLYTKKITTVALTTVCKLIVITITNTVSLALCLVSGFSHLHMIIQITNRDRKRKTKMNLEKPTKPDKHIRTFRYVF